MTARSQPKVVLAVSQAVSTPSEGVEPDRDFLRLAREMGAELVGNAGLSASPLVRRIQRVTALDIVQAMHVLREHPDADCYVSFSERVGIPLGMALARRKPRPAHVLIAHRLDTRPKRLLNRLGHWTEGVDRIVALSSSQRDFAERVFRVTCRFVKGCVVDESFFRPDETVAEEDYVLSVGSESRDYETLARAAEKLPYRFKILASSPWCRRRSRGGRSRYANVEFLSRVSYQELRDLYRRAKLVAVPLRDVTYAAGLNGVEEAITVNKPVIVSASRGIIDYVEHMKNAYVVALGDADAMASAIDTVYRDADLRGRLRSGASRAVADFANLAAYTEALEAEVRSALAGGEERATT